MAPRLSGLHVVQRLLKALLHLPLSITEERGYVDLEAPSRRASDENCRDVPLNVLSPIVCHRTATLSTCLAVICINGPASKLTRKLTDGHIIELL
jgi:hypothetical protein